MSQPPPSPPPPATGPLWERLLGVGLVVLVVTLLGWADRTGLLQGVELSLYDQRINWIGRALPAGQLHVTLVGADEGDINTLGWPLPDHHLARLLAGVMAHQPRAVGLDLYRDQPRGEGAAELEAVLRRHPAILGVMKFPVGSAPGIPAHPVLEEEHDARVGFADFTLDEDNKVRRGLLFLDDGQRVTSSLSLQLALNYLAPLKIHPQPDPAEPELLRLGRTTIRPLSATEGGYVGLDDRGYQFLLDFREARGRLPIYTFREVLEGRVPGNEFRDRLVIVGTAAESVKDYFPTPLQLAHRSFRLLYGIELHAFAANQLLRMALEGEGVVETLGDSRELAWLVAWGVLGGLVGFLLRGMAWVLAALTVAEAALGGSVLAAFAMNWWIPWAGPALAIPLATLPVIAVRVQGEQWRRRAVEVRLAQVEEERGGLAREAQRLAREQAQLLESTQATAIHTNRDLGLAYQGQGRLDLALDKFLQCPMNQEMATILYNLAMDFERQRQLEKARSVLRRVAEWDPEFLDVTRRLAQEVSQTATLAGGIGALSATLVKARSPEQFPMLGRYRIEKELGKGAMGVVYQARDPTINRLVAIKVLSYSQDFQDADLKEARERFFREAEGMGRLQHPNIVAIHDAGDEADLAWLAMEFIEGRDLTPYLKRPQLLPVPVVLFIGAKVAAALDFAHANGVVHRDIKPANVMFNPKSRLIKLTDFGIARLTDAGGTSLTQTGILIGTLAYMSPEQVGGSRVDGRSDLFSLGVTLYHLLTGQLPFHARETATLLFQITQQPHLDILAVRPDLPPCIRTIMDRVLAKRPGERYQRGNQLARDLAACLQTLKGGGAGPPAGGGKAPAGSSPPRAAGGGKAAAVPSSAPSTPRAAGGGKPAAPSAAIPESRSEAATVIKRQRPRE